MGRLIVGSVLVLAWAVCSLALEGYLPWLSHVAALAGAAYLFMIGGGSMPARVVAITPGLLLSSTHACSVPFRSMLSRLPDAAASQELPPLWANGGIALLPVLVFAAVQIWMICAMAPVAMRNQRAMWKSACVAALLASAVSIVAAAVSAFVSVALAQVSVERNLFPGYLDAYFGLFWFSVDVALVQGGLGHQSIRSRW